eukprot:COSAG06_NODE_39887_length_407_cov_2.146104_1_plen_63_part_01
MPGGLVVGLRDPAHSIHVNSEAYTIGGDPTYGFARFSAQLGALQLPRDGGRGRCARRKVDGEG